MRSFRDCSLKCKLTLITMAISGAAMLLACGAFAVYEQIAFRHVLARDFSMLADMFDDNIAPGLAFHDPASMRQTLATLGADPQIVAAGVYDQKGELVARYERGSRPGSFAFPAVRSTAQQFGAGRLDTFKDIVLAGEKIGVVYIATDLGVLRARAWRLVGGVAALLVGCSLVALLLASRLQKIISQPIAELARTAKTVAAGQDYSVRAVKRGDDEVGVLIEGFNAMLAQIQARDVELQRANEELEHRVEKRTFELKEAQQAVAREHAKFKFIFDAVPIGISLHTPGEEGSRLVNPACERITGISAADSRRTGAFASASHPEDYARQRALTEKFQRGEIDHYTIEKRYVQADGSVTWAVLASRMFADPATGKRQSVTTLVDITERKAAESALADTHQRLLEASRRAGMAEVATGVLHNVGNVLNSVNVSATLVGDYVRASKSGQLARVAALLREHEAALPTFFAGDPRGRELPGYLAALSTHFAGQETGALTELEGLRKNIEHIRDIVAMQQSYAKFSGVSERVGIAELAEDALRMNATALVRHQVTVVRDFRARPMLTVEKHKVLQILINVIRNAKYACDEGGRSAKQIVVRIEEDAERVAVSVSDNGVGIAPENLTRIFAHGFTTRKDGHGFGLHSGALAAKELGGELTVHSDGPGRGATFVLFLPKTSPENAA